MAGAGREGSVRAGPGASGRRQPREQQQQQQQQQGRRPRSAPGPGPLSNGKRKADREPRGLDLQDIPFRLREIMRSRQEMKTPLSNRRRKAAQAVFRESLEKEAQGTEPDIPVPQFKRKKGESDRAFVQRMEQEAQHVLFLSRNQASCQPEAPAAPKEKSEGKRAFRRRRLDRSRQRQAEKATERLEQELLQDPVKFGDVVLQPPELTARPRASTSLNQPGRKSLLLKMCLNPGVGDTRTPSTSPAQQRILGVERARAVLAYRVLKQQRQQAAR